MTNERARIIWSWALFAFWLFAAVAGYFYFDAADRKARNPKVLTPAEKEEFDRVERNIRRSLCDKLKAAPSSTQKDAEALDLFTKNYCGSVSASEKE